MISWKRKVLDQSFQSIQIILLKGLWPKSTCRQCSEAVPQPAVGQSGENVLKTPKNVLKNSQKCVENSQKCVENSQLKILAWKVNSSALIPKTISLSFSFAFLISCQTTCLVALTIRLCSLGKLLTRGKNELLMNNENHKTS